MERAERLSMRRVVQRFEACKCTVQQILYTFKMGPLRGSGEYKYVDVRSHFASDRVSVSMRSGDG